MFSVPGILHHQPSQVFRQAPYSNILRLKARLHIASTPFIPSTGAKTPRYIPFSVQWSIGYNEVFRFMENPSKQGTIRLLRRAFLKPRQTSTNVK